MSVFRHTSLSEIILAGLAAVLAMAYSITPSHVPTGIAIAQAALSWAFVLFFLIWRSRPLTSAAGMVACLAAWAIAWVVALPVNTGVSPWLIAAPLAVFATARYSDKRTWVRVILACTLLGSFASPVMWKIQPDFSLQYRSGKDLFFVLIFHWLLLLCVYFAALRLRSHEHARMAALREAQEEERLLIARELHDVLAHSLTLIKVQANAGIIEKKEATNSLKAIKDEADNALQEVRSIVTALRSHSPARITDSTETIASIITGFEIIGLDITASVDDTELPALQHLALSRIIAESLTNVVRHQGKDARVELKLTVGDPAHLRVESWGIAQGASAGAGAGLVGLSERAAALGGRLKASGTAEHYILTAELPLRRSR